jgi:hypothetical protein
MSLEKSLVLDGIDPYSNTIPMVKDFDVADRLKTVNRSSALNKSEAIESIKRRFSIQNLNETENDLTTNTIVLGTTHTSHGSSRSSSIATDNNLIANDHSYMVNINKIGIYRSSIVKQKNGQENIYDTCKSITQDVNSK